MKSLLNERRRLQASEPDANIVSRVGEVDGKFMAGGLARPKAIAGRSADDTVGNCWSIDQQG